MTRRRGPAGKDRHDHATGDLFQFEPEREAAIPNYPKEKVKAARLRDKISKAVSATLADVEDLERADIAYRMSEFLGVEVPENTLNGYASEARQTNTISVERAIALCHATGDPRLLALIADELGLAVIEAQYLPAVWEAMATAEIERLTDAKKRFRHQWDRKS